MPKDWASAMRERLRHHDQQVQAELAKVLAGVETELLKLETFEEALNVLGDLKLVLERHGTVEAWLKRAGTAMTAERHSAEPAMEIDMET